MLLSLIFGKYVIVIVLKYFNWLNLVISFYIVGFIWFMWNSDVYKLYIVYVWIIYFVSNLELVIIVVMSRIVLIKKLNFCLIYEFYYIVEL